MPNAGKVVPGSLAALASNSGTASTRTIFWCGEAGYEFGSSCYHVIKLANTSTCLHVCNVPRIAQFHGKIVTGGTEQISAQTDLYISMNDKVKATSASHQGQQLLGLRLQLGGAAG